MVKSKIVKIISVIISLSGLAVMSGWIFFPDFLKIISPNLIVMRFTVSLCFIAAGIVLYASADENRENSLVAQTVLPAAILLILLLMSPMLASSILGVNTGIDNFSIQMEIMPTGGLSFNEASFGRPPVPVMIGFILIAIAGMMVFSGSRKYLAWMSSPLVLIGVVAMVGYAVGQPWLYYSIAGVSSAMAFATAPLFVLIGVGFILARKEGEIHPNPPFPKDGIPPLKKGD